MKRASPTPNGPSDHQPKESKASSEEKKAKPARERVDVAHGKSYERDQDDAGATIYHSEGSGVKLDGRAKSITSYGCSSVAGCTDAAIRAQADEERKRAHHPAALERFLELWGPELRFEVSRIEVSNKARYSNTTVRSPGGTVFKVTAREAGCGVASDEAQEMWEAERGDDEDEDCWEDPAFQAFYEGLSGETEAELADAMEHDPLGTLQYLLSSQAVSHSDGVVLVTQGDDLRISASSFSVTAPDHEVDFEATPFGTVIRKSADERE